VISIDGLKKNYGSFTALNNINLELLNGEFIAILGPSGCGKTTLLRLLAGFMKPTEGTITIDNELAASSSKLVPPEKRNISMVFQSFALWPHMTVEDHIRFPLKHHRFGRTKGKEEQEIRIGEALGMVGLTHLKTRYPAELSGGQKQRVALARAIVPKPSLLLMDEPLSALDAELRMEMRREISRIHRKLGTTIIYVTHDQGEALAMADRIVVMNNGRIEQIGTPESIYNNPQSVFVATFVGKSNLIKGEWIGEDRFIPAEFPNVSWKDIGISKEIKSQNLYPVRPEQWKLGEAEQEEMTGIIQFAQFQGNEIHYSVQVGEETINVYGSVFEKRFLPGDAVSLRVFSGVEERAVLTGSR
jgi:iron(III) transport system ATP-binding protein